MQESQAITRKSASNLALAFILLPKPKRDGMAALYAFCREVDDVADEDAVPVEERRRQLAAWREDARAACGGGVPQFAVNRELQPVIQSCRLPFELFDDLIRGVEMDLDIQRYETHAQLDQYCYRVASVVGLLSIEIFGYTNPRCRDYAVHLGKALQLTNILRDVRTDAERGRIYLPLEELRRFGVREEEVLKFRYTPQFRALAESVAARAKEFYRLAREALPAEDRRAMIAAELMGSVYWRLLRKLEARGFDVFGPVPTRLNKLQKLHLIFRTWFRLSSGVTTPNYGLS
ncbi:MAG: presqualene diphosphate synthase HpnD [Verrucomicrobia bacterium]|nr:presqualene diphosphate synthase HpnD [Verrucomicrobiota bacterium]